MKSTHAILIIGLLLVLSVLWLGRYELVTAQQGVFIYRIDRWTGNMR